jgi:hypothetical protein
MTEFFHPIKWAIVGCFISWVVGLMVPPGKALMIGLVVSIVAAAIGG